MHRRWIPSGVSSNFLILGSPYLGLDDEKGRQELRPRGPSMLPLNSIIKDAFDKFDQDFQAANLPEGKYIKAPPSIAKWYKVGQPCYEDKIQELNTDFAKICISPLRRSSLRSKKVPTLKGQQSVDTRKPVSIWIFGTSLS